MLLSPLLILLFSGSSVGERHVSRALAGDDHADDHADDHGDDHGDDHAFSVFGGMQSLDIYLGSVSFIIIVFCILVLEHFFHELHTATHDTPFAEMVAAIEKELMIVGVMAFIFKCIVQSSSFLPLDWYHALEFGGKYSLILRLLKFV